jgi:hypothetical protein
MNHRVVDARSVADGLMCLPAIIATEPIAAR